MSYGWLAPRPDIQRDESWFGMYLQPSLETRWEEFTFTRDALRVYWSVDETEAPPTLLDMGCGFEPGVHIMPEIAASEGWQVEAIDKLDAPGPTHLWSQNKPHPLIRRRILDMRQTDYPDAHFDAVLSISVLEHVSPADRAATFAEARRVLRPGGKLIVTMDGLLPILVPGFTFGERVVPREKLHNNIGQPVSFMVGTRCT